MSILTLLLIVLIVAAIFGGFGHSRNWGYVGWSPLGIVLIILIVMLLTGHLR